MDQVKIGKFIAKLRKEKKMTQQELAERLNVTDRAVSNWENGRRMPDISFFKPLCSILGITVNELMLGEKIPKEVKIDKADDTILKTLNENQKNERKQKKILCVLCVLLLLILVGIFFGYKRMHPNIDIYSLNFNYLDEPNELLNAFTYKGQNIYYYGIENAFLCDQKQTCFDLKESLDYKQSSLKRIQEYFTYQVGLSLNHFVLYDGGTNIYYNENYAAILCNTFEGNNDIYFGKREMLDALDGKYCGHEKSSIQKFVRTYHIENIQESNEDIKVTLINNKNERATVTVLNNYNLFVGKTYEFTFYTFENFSDTISNIFENSVYVHHKETEKIGEEQINEPIVVNEKQISELSELENVVMTIKEGTLTRKGATVIITDISGKNYIYGTWYRIEQRIDGIWQEKHIVLEGNYGWDDIAYHVDYTGHLVFDINWEWLYGILENGYYRIVKSASLPDSLEEKYFSVEFEINNQI